MICVSEEKRDKLMTNMEASLVAQAFVAATGDVIRFYKDREEVTHIVIEVEGNTNMQCFVMGIAGLEFLKVPRKVLPQTKS